MINLTKISKNELAVIDEKMARGDDSFEEIDIAVKAIIANVRQNGDEALLAYTKTFDGVSLASLKVSEEEITEALETIEPSFLTILKNAKDNIREFHQHQLEKSWFVKKGNGIILGQKITPLKRVGVYVPGGKAAYPSTVLMDVIPALWRVWKKLLSFHRQIKKEK